MFAPRARRHGFTLVEMLVVLLIIAAVAALVIPRLGFVQDQAGNATAAHAIAGAVSNLEAYKTSTGSYPLGMDSLVDDTGAIYSKLWKHQQGASFFGLGADLDVGSLSTSGLRQSFGHSFQADSLGKVYVYNHSSTSTDPSNSATSLLNLTVSSGTTDKLAFVKTSADSLIKAAGYPLGSGDPSITAGAVKLLAFGLGPKTGSIGETMVSAPRHSEQDQDTYGRYIAIFALYENGKSAHLRTVVDSFGSSVDSNITSYNKSGPEHN